MAIAQSAKSVFATTDSNGNVHRVNQAEARDWAITMEKAISDGFYWVETKTDLDAIVPADGTYPGGVVTDDATATNNGYYFYDHDADQWTRSRGFSDSLAALTNIAGTTNAITADTDVGVNPSDVVALLITPTLTNTGASTITLNSGTAVDLLAPDGTALVGGELVADIPMILIANGSDWRIAFPANAVSQTQANVTAAEAAQTAAETAQAAAEASVQNKFVATRTALKAIDTSASTHAYLTEEGRAGQFVFFSGDYSTQVTSDTYEGIYLEADDTASSSGAWVRLNSFNGPANALWFGAVGDDSTDNTATFASALALCKSNAIDLYIPAGTFRVTEFVNKGVSITGAGKDKTIIYNASNTNKVMEWGDASDDSGYSQRTSLRDITVKGNTNSTYGIYVGGPDTDNSNWGTSSRGCQWENIRIIDVGDGPAFRLNAWVNNLQNVEMWDGKVGLEVGDEAHNTTAIGLYISSMTAEGVKTASGLGPAEASQISVLSSVVQHCGGTNGMIDISGGATWNLDGIYMEHANTGTAACVYVNTPFVSVENLRYSSAGSDNDTLSIVVNNDQNQIEFKNIISYSNCDEIVKITGTSPNTRVSGCRMASGSATNGHVNDASTGGYTLVDTVGGGEGEGEVNWSNVNFGVDSLSVDGAVISSGSSTPLFHFVSTSTYSTQELKWSRIGNVAYVTLKMAWSGLDTADASVFTIAGLPFDFDGFTNLVLHIAPSASTGLSMTKPLFLEAYDNVGVTKLRLSDIEGNIETYDGGVVQASGTLIASGVGLIA